VAHPRAGPSRILWKNHRHDSDEVPLFHFCFVEAAAERVGARIAGLLECNGARCTKTAMGEVVPLSLE